MALFMQKEGQLKYSCKEPIAWHPLINETLNALENHEKCAHKIDNVLIKCLKNSIFSIMKDLNLFEEL